MTGGSRAVERVEWVDAAKGISIVLVVLFHATLVDAQPPESGPWWVVNAVFATLRMPLFFLASGLFAGSVLRRSWRDVLGGRVLLLVWVYLLWLTVRRLVLAALGRELVLDWQAYLLPDSEMWFLYVLAVFFVAARLLRDVPRLWALVPAAAASVLVGASQVEFHRFDDMLVFFVFFLAGASYSREIRARASRVTLGGTVGVWALFLAGAVGVAAAGLRAVPPFWFLLSVAALAAGLSLAVILVRHGLGLGRALVHLGRNTLPVYVMHSVLIALMVRSAGALGWDVQAALVGPLLLAVIAIALALALHVVLRRVPGLFDAPASLRRLLGVGAPPTAAVARRGEPSRQDLGAA